MHGSRTWLIGLLLACLPAAVAGAQELVDGVELFKGVERDDGELDDEDGEGPYYALICVSGAVAESPVGEARVTLPEASEPESIPLPDCLEQDFETREDLDEAFPSDGEEYRFDLSKGGAEESLSVVWEVSPPEGFAEIESPSDDDDVDAESDLLVTWSIDADDCEPGGGVVDCADGILLFLLDPEESVVAYDSLDIDATETTIPADDLEPDTSYELEVEVYRESEGTGSRCGAVTCAAVYQDINEISFTTVPEPGAPALGLAALAAVAGLARRGRRGARGA